MQVTITRGSNEVVLSDDEVFIIYQKQRYELIKDSIDGYLENNYPIEEYYKYMRDELLIQYTIDAYCRLENLHLTDVNLTQLAFKEAMHKRKLG